MNLPFVNVRNDGVLERETRLSGNERMHLLPNGRRRLDVHALKRIEDPDAHAELCAHVAAWETETEPEEIDREDRRSVYVTLRRTHLPKLDEKNVIQFDESENTVQSTELLDNIEVHTEVLHEKEISWSLYYLGLAGVCGLLLVAVITEAPLFDLFEPIHVGLFAAGIFFVSAAAHHFVERHSRFGVTQKPPEIHQQQ